MRRKSLTQILIEEKRSANREELEFLFCRIFELNKASTLLSMIKLPELKRTISIKLYEQNVYQLDKDKGRTLNRISLVVGSHRKTLERWIKAHENPKPEK